MNTLSKIFIFIWIILLMGTSCEKENSDNSSNKGQIVFFTNAQIMFNCGPFDVDVYINNDFEGAISGPSIKDPHPECKSSDTTVLVERKAGKYKYTAEIDCGDNKGWSGEVEVIANSCIYVYLDIDSCNLKKQ